MVSRCSSWELPWIQTQCSGVALESKFLTFFRCVCHCVWCLHVIPTKTVSIHGCWSLYVGLMTNYRPSSGPQERHKHSKKRLFWPFRQKTKSDRTVLNQPLRSCMLVLDVSTSLSWFSCRYATSLSHPTISQSFAIHPLTLVIPRKKSKVREILHREPISHQREHQWIGPLS